MCSSMTVCRCRLLVDLAALLQKNAFATVATRDIAAEHLLDVYEQFRLFFFVRGPVIHDRLRQHGIKHPVFEEVPCLAPFRENGKWALWCDPVVKWDGQHKMLMDHLFNPLATIQIGAYPSHVATHVMEAVKVRLLCLLHAMYAWLCPHAIR